MMATIETIYVHEVCNSQLVKLQDKPFFCEVCNREVGLDEIKVVDNTPSPFAG